MPEEHSMNIFWKLNNWHHLARQSRRLLKLSAANLAMGPIERWNFKIQGALEHTRPCQVRSSLTKAFPHGKRYWKLYKSLSKSFSEFICRICGKSASISIGQMACLIPVWKDGYALCKYANTHNFRLTSPVVWFGDIEYSVVPRNKVRRTVTNRWLCHSQTGSSLHSLR